MGDFRAELAALVAAYNEHGGGWTQEDVYALWDAVEHARDVLAQPEPAPAADGEVAELAAWLTKEMPPGTYIGDPTWWASRIAGRAHILMKRQALRPIPVSERLPGPEDCLPWPDEPDADPWCWLGSNVDDAWEWEQRSAKSLSYCNGFTHWLPAHALPLPEVE